VGGEVVLAGEPTDGADLAEQLGGPVPPNPEQEVPEQWNAPVDAFWREVEVRG
jgi:hypothetical protein